MITVTTDERGRTFQSGDAQVFIPTALLDQVWPLKFVAGTLDLAIADLLNALDAQTHKDYSNDLSGDYRYQD